MYVCMYVYVCSSYFCLFVCLFVCLCVFLSQSSIPKTTVQASQAQQVALTTALLTIIPPTVTTRPEMTRLQQQQQQKQKQQKRRHQHQLTLLLATDTNLQRVMFTEEREKEGEGEGEGEEERCHWVVVWRHRGHQRDLRG